MYKFKSPATRSRSDMPVIGKGWCQRASEREGEMWFDVEVT